MYKKRILFSGEASFLNTGFSNIYRSLLPRLAKTGKFEVAEHGSYAPINHPDVENFIAGRWKFYPGMPSTEAEAAEFRKFEVSNHPQDRGANIAQFGAWNFDQVLLDFKPDIVFALRDHWMDSYILRSCLRPWFKFIWMPTVDSPAQREEWISDYEKVNLCLAYSDFGVHTLKMQSKRAKVFPKPMRPGVDLDIFCLMDKSAIRESFNLNKENFVFGILQRNQSRKNILEVIDAFALLKNTYKEDTKVQKSLLLLHTSWPDNLHSFDYPRHIKRLQSDAWMPNHRPGIMYDILQTMICHNCQQASLTFAFNLFNKPIEQKTIHNKKMQGIFLQCPYCQQPTLTTPNTGYGVSREQLAQIYNLMDVLVQASIAEGDGMPTTEAKACGLPVIVTDHSALAEKGRFPGEYLHIKEAGITENDYSVHKGGIVHKVAAYRHEPETGCIRAVPDINDLMQKMHLLITDTSLHKQMSIDARKCVEDNYDWDKLALTWAGIFDKIHTIDRNSTWDSPIEPVNVTQSQSIPPNLSDDRFIEWLYLSILKYPAVDMSGFQLWMSHLKAGVSREIILNQFIQISNQQSESSNARNILRFNASQQPSKKTEFI